MRGVREQGEHLEQDDVQVMRVATSSESRRKPEGAGPHAP